MDIQTTAEATWPIHTPHLNLNHAVNLLKTPKWQEAILEKLNVLHKNNTWKIVNIQPKKSSINIKDEIDRYKARLLAKDFMQTFTMDYHETFAPLAKMTSILNLLSLASMRDCNYRNRM